MTKKAVNLTVRAASLGSVAVEGNQKTRDYVIESEIESKVGEPFNLETFYRLGRINQLGFFSAVEPDITEEWRDDRSRQLGVAGARAADGLGGHRRRLQYE